MEQRKGTLSILLNFASLNFPQIRKRDSSQQSSYSLFSLLASVTFAQIPLFARLYAARLGRCETLETNTMQRSFPRKCHVGHGFLLTAPLLFPQFLDIKGVERQELNPIHRSTPCQEEESIRIDTKRESRRANDIAYDSTRGTNETKLNCFLYDTFWPIVDRFSKLLPFNVEYQCTCGNVTFITQFLLVIPLSQPLSTVATVVTPFLLLSFRYILYLRDIIKHDSSLFVHRRYLLSIFKRSNRTFAYQDHSPQDSVYIIYLLSSRAFLTELLISLSFKSTRSILDLTLAITVDRKTLTFH